MRKEKVFILEMDDNLVSELEHVYNDTVVRYDLSEAHSILIYLLDVVFKEACSDIMTHYLHSGNLDRLQRYGVDIGWLSDIIMNLLEEEDVACKEIIDAINSSDFRENLAYVRINKLFESNAIDNPTETDKSYITDAVVSFILDVVPIKELVDIYCKLIDAKVFDDIHDVYSGSLVEVSFETRTISIRIDSGTYLKNLHSL